MILARSKELMNKRRWVYVLKCKDRTFYVGITQALKRRLQQHRDGCGAWFTRDHSPLNLIEVRPAKSELDEFNVWKEYAAKYGHKRVGGYSPYICNLLGFVWPFTKTYRKPAGTPARSAQPATCSFPAGLPTHQAERSEAQVRNGVKRLHRKHVGSANLPPEMTFAGFRKT